MLNCFNENDNKTDFNFEKTLKFLKLTLKSLKE